MSFIRFYFIIAANHITKRICFLFSCWHCICSYKFLFVILAGLFGLLGNSKENIFKNMFFLRNQKTKKKRTRALWTRRLPRLTFANKLNAIPMLRQQFSQNLFSATATDCCRLKCCSRESKREWDYVSALLHHSQTNWVALYRRTRNIIHRQWRNLQHKRQQHQQQKHNKTLGGIRASLRWYRCSENNDDAVAGAVTTLYSSWLSQGSRRECRHGQLLLCWLVARIYVYVLVYTTTWSAFLSL